MLFQPFIFLYFALKVTFVLQLIDFQVGPRVSPQNQQQMPPSSGGQAVQPSGNPMPNSANTVAVAAPSQDPNQSGAAAPVPKQEINTAALCRYGLEVVQEIVSRMTEVFTLLKTLQASFEFVFFISVALTSVLRVHLYF